MKTNDPLEPLLKEAKSVIRKRIVVLTGAGVSAESGVPTFRDQAFLRFLGQSPHVGYRVRLL